MKKKRHEDPIAPAFLPKGGPESLVPYRGKWVVMDQEGEIQASGETFSSAAEAAKAHSVRDPVFAYVGNHGFIG